MDAILSMRRAEHRSVSIFRSVVWEKERSQCFRLVHRASASWPFRVSDRWLPPGGLPQRRQQQQRPGAVAGGAAGGPIGAMTESGVPKEHAHVCAEGVRRGGTLVTARVDESLYAEADAILRQSNWVDRAPCRLR